MRMILPLLAALLAAAPAMAHSYRLKAIQIGHAWGLPSASGETRAFFPLFNAGKEVDEVLSMTSPAASRIEAMQPTAGGTFAPTRLVLAGGKPLPMRDGGFHLRLSGLKKPLKHGDKIPLTLAFRKSGSVTVEIWIEQRSPGGAAHH
jgi:periplasmic copper chaperone A